MTDEQIAELQEMLPKVGEPESEWTMIRTSVARAIIAASASAQPVELPRPGSPEASAMIDSVLDEYNWPSNTKNAARAGFEAARRMLTAPPQSTADTVRVPRCKKCAELMAKSAEVVAQTHLAGLSGHTKGEACIHRPDDPQGCYRVRCQLGKVCAAAPKDTTP